MKSKLLKGIMSITVLSLMVTSFVGCSSDSKSSTNSGSEGSDIEISVVLKALNSDY